MNNYFDKEKYPNCYDAYQYAVDVVVGDILNSKFTIGACTRFLKDLEYKKFPFDADKAERFLRVVQKLHHVKGKWKTPEIIYEPWQKFIFANIIGFIDTRTGERRFRTAHIEIPRGNAKSAMASQSVLYFLALDNPKGNEISCLGTKTDQSRIVLDSARAMAKSNLAFLKETGVEVLAHRLVHEKSNSFARALSSDDKSLDGLNDILAVMDELHAMSAELFDVVSSGMSKRNDSLLLCITTSGFSVDGVGHAQSVYAKKVCLGEVNDDQFFAIVYTIDDGDDIHSENSWRKANPNYGVSVDPITLKAKSDKAIMSPRDLPNFKVKHLNIWLSEAKAYYDMNIWDKCADPTLTFEQFKGMKCFSAIDLASKIDLASFGTVFFKDDIYYLFDKTYIPEDRANEIRNSLYDESIATGHLIATPGEAINIERLENDFIEMSKQVKILGAPFDPWNAVSFSQTMQKKKIEMIEFKMSTANLSEATKTLDALMRQGKIRHNGSKLLRWCVSNVVCKEDAVGNVFPKKSNEKLKIDPAIALLMALACWLQQKKETSVYEERGIRTVR